MPSPDDLGTLRAALASDDAAQRARALELLEAVIAERAHEVVAEALESENPQVREQAETLRARLDRGR